jgi:cobalt-zinc-cadmium efflux system outer membrane protein
MAQGRKSVHGLGLCLLLAVAAHPVRGQSIEDLIERAAAHNRDYLSGLERVREAEALVRQAGMRPSPSLEGEGGSSALLGSPGTQEYSVAFVQPLETGGKRARRLEVASRALDRARAETAERKRQLALEVRQRWAEALNARDRLAVLAEATRINGEMLRLVAARVDAGDAAPLERDLLSIEVNRLEVDRLLLEARDRAALLDLRRTGAIPDGAATLPRASPLPLAMPPRADLLRLALDVRPDLSALRAAEEHARSAVALAEAEGAPDIAASARYGFRNATLDQRGFDSAGALVPIRDRDSVLSFGVSVPLFTRRRNQGNVEAAVARSREAALRSEYLAAAIPAEVEAALLKWQAAVSALSQLERSVLGQAEKNLEVIRQAWRLGQLRLIDVLNEQRRLTELQQARVEAQTEVLKTAADLAHAVGGQIR